MLASVYNFSCFHVSYLNASTRSFVNSCTFSPFLPIRVSFVALARGVRLGHMGMKVGINKLDPWASDPTVIGFDQYRVTYRRTDGALSDGQIDGHADYIAKSR